MAKTDAQIGKDVRKKITNLESGYPAFQENILKRREEIKAQIQQLQIELARLQIGWDDRAKELDIAYNDAGKNKKAVDFIDEMRKKKAPKAEEPPMPPALPPGE